MKRIWDEHATWSEAERAWDEDASAVAKTHPLKRLTVLPQMPGITKETARFLKIKSLNYMLFHPEGKEIIKHILKHPIRYLLSYSASVLRKKSYIRDEDFFFYGLRSENEFIREVKRKKSLLVVGFSYCQKPFECPSGRFTDQCTASSASPICRQCDIGKVVHAMPARALPLFIPTVHYIGRKIFEIKERHADKQLYFIITACEMTLQMFSDWGNMAGIKGIGVRLDGRICNTMKAFELSERGIKPGLTVTTATTQSRILNLIRQIRSPHQSSACA